MDGESSTPGYDRNVIFYKFYRFLDTKSRNCADIYSTLIVAMSSTENMHVRRVHTICRHLTSAASLGEVVDGILVRPQCAPGMERVVGKTALSVVGGTVPLPQHEVARRAYHYALDPMQNPIKQVAIV